MAFLLAGLSLSAHDNITTCDVLTDDVFVYKITFENYHELRMRLEYMSMLRAIDTQDAYENYRRICTLLEIPLLPPEEIPSFIDALKRQVWVFGQTLTNEQRSLIIQKDVCDITGLDKAEVLRALFRAAKPKGIGCLLYNPEDELTDEVVNWILNECGGWADYVNGRAIKVNILSHHLCVVNYNEYNGFNRAQEVLAPLMARRNQRVIGNGCQQVSQHERLGLFSRVVNNLRRLR